MAIQLKLFHTTLSTTPHRCLTSQVNAVSGKAQQLINSGTVRPILPKEAGLAVKSEGYILLDIRPEWEREKARVSGSLHVPLFVEDMDNGPLTLMKKWVHFGYIGLWTGQNFTMINPDFLQQVEVKVPDKEESKVLVACGEGLRSMMAASKLHEGGYRNLGWLAGGFTRAKDGDFSGVEGPEKLQYATIGGECLLLEEDVNALEEMYPQGEKAETAWAMTVLGYLAKLVLGILGDGEEKNLAASFSFPLEACIALKSKNPTGLYRICSFRC